MWMNDMGEMDHMNDDPWGVQVRQLAGMSDSGWMIWMIWMIWMTWMIRMIWMIGMI